MNEPSPAALLRELPKAELHLHLEGSMQPATLVELARRHGVTLTLADAVAGYATRDFAGFLEAFKWATSFLRTPTDYALVTERLLEQLHEQNVVYAEVTLSVGVMLRRGQDVEANLAAVQQAAERTRAAGLRVNWICDAVRQFGPAAAMEVARRAAQMQSVGVVALGLGGDELALPAAEFRAVYDYARSQGLRALVHAGELGGPEAVRDAVDLLGAERIGHGIAAIRDGELIDLLARRQIPLEICLTSNLRTGALARQLGKSEATIEEHPLRELFSRGIRVALSTDDPAMFGTDLLREYGLAAALGLTAADLARVAESSFAAAFLPPEERQAFVEEFRARAKSLGLI